MNTQRAVASSMIFCNVRTFVIFVILQLLVLLVLEIGHKNYFFTEDT